MSRTQKLFKKADILTAIKDSKGSLTVVARNLIKITGIYCCRNTAEKNVNRFPETIQALEDEVQMMGDFVEMKGFELVNKGDGQMIRYYLSTKFKNRGYRLNDPDDSNQVPGVNSAPIKIVIEGNTLPTVRDEIENGN